MIHISVIPGDDDPTGDLAREDTVTLFADVTYMVSFESIPGTGKLDRVHGIAEKVAVKLRAAGYRVDIRYPIGYGPAEGFRRGPRLWPDGDRAALRRFHPKRMGE